MIKKAISVTFLLAIILLAGCEKLNELIRFNIDHSTSITIPANGIVANVPFNIPSPEIQNSSQQTFQNNNTRADLVEKATLSELNLQITAPADQNFGFLNEIEIYIKADGLDETLIASSYDIPDNIGNTLDLTTSDANLKEFIKKESYSITTRVVTDEVLNRDVEIDVNMKFNVQANVF